MNRLITAAVALPVLIASILYPPLRYLFVAIAVAAIVVALYEFWFLAKRVGAKPDIVVGYAATAAMLVAFFFNVPEWLIVDRAGAGRRRRWRRRCCGARRSTR